MSQADPAAVDLMARRVVEEDLITGLLNMMRCKAMPSDIHFDISWVFVNLAVPTFGCQVLLEYDVPRQMLDMYDLATVSLSSNKTVENILWLIGNIAGENADTVERLMNSGIFHRCLEVLARIAENPYGVSRELTNVVAWLFASLLRCKPPPPFSFMQPALPHIVALLEMLDPRKSGEALKELANCCCSIFSDKVKDADWTLLRSTGLLARLLVVSRFDIAVEAVTKLIGNAAAHDDADVTRLVLGDDTLDWLAAVTSLPTHKTRHQVELLWLLSNAAADSQRLREKICEMNLFGSLLHRLPARLRRDTGDVASPSVMHLCREASWALHNILSESHSAAVPPALLRAGAMDFLAAALANSALYRAQELISRLADCVEYLLDAGSTDRDEAYIEHGDPPSNEYLAAFCAAGAGAVLMTALSHGQEPACAVVDLFNVVIGPMIGADEPAKNSEDVPAAFLALLDLSTVGAVEDSSGEDEGNNGNAHQNNVR
jgi:hypothetical protein